MISGMGKLRYHQSQEQSEEKNGKDLEQVQKLHKESAPQIRL